MRTTRRTRIIALQWRESTYTESFYSALSETGVEVVEGWLEGRWLNDNLRSGDCIHIHWPSFAYTESRSISLLIKRFLRFASLLIYCRMRRARLAWTAHNLYPHDCSVLPAIDVLARRLVIRLSEFILVHGQHAEAALCKEFPAAKQKCVRIPHGNWIDLYPNTVTRESARSALDIPGDAFTYLMIGSCKPYKRIEFLIETFSQLPENSRLLIAGGFSDRTYEQAIAKLAAADERIIFHPGFVEASEIQNYMAACDVVVAPYREILTSGTAMLAMSFGRPLASVDTGFLKDVVTDRTGILFDKDDPSAMREALKLARDRSFSRQDILEAAKRHTFHDAATIMLRRLGAPSA